jgi:hypothetical protein
LDESHWTVRFVDRLAAAECDSDSESNRDLAKRERERVAAAATATAVSIGIVVERELGAVVARRAEGRVETVVGNNRSSPSSTVTTSKDSRGVFGR